MIVDVTLLLYARDEQAHHHERARQWLTEQLNGSRQVGLAWLSLGSFVRVSTHARIFESPLSAAQAWGQVREWLAIDVVWTPNPGPGYPEILGGLIERHQVTGNLVPDAQLAALAIENGLVVASTDTDFARFTEARWENPIAD